MASEIVDGVIRSITPGMVLRSYLETYEDLTLDRLKKILRSHYGAKNTSELYQTLASLLETGLQDESIRAKIRPFLKDSNVTDEVLMQQMSMATSAEKERDKKLKNNTKTKQPPLSVSAVSDGPPKEKEGGKKNSPQNDLLTAISAIKSEVEALKSEVRKNSNQSVPPGKWPERRRPPLC
ncbi:unnamed protein product, partial [Porites lobata]